MQSHMHTCNRIVFLFCPGAYTTRSTVHYSKHRCSKLECTVRTCDIPTTSLMNTDGSAISASERLIDPHSTMIYIDAPEYLDFLVLCGIVCMCTAFSSQLQPVECRHGLYGQCDKGVLIFVEHLCT